MSSRDPAGPAPGAPDGGDLASGLRDSEARYRDLFEQSMAGVYRTTAAGRILDCNRAFAAILGYGREELLQLPAQALYFQVEERDGNLRRLRAEGQVVSGEVVMRRKDGAPVWVLFSEHLRRDGAGVEVIEGTLIDISARRRAAEALRLSEQRLQMLVSELPVVLFGLDREGVFTVSEGRGLTALGLRQPSSSASSASEQRRPPDPAKARPP